MLKIKNFLFLILCSSILLANPLQEGVDYMRLKNPLTHQKGVIEVFSYRCIHCFNHHEYQTIQKLKSNNPKLSYQFYPTEFGSALTSPLRELFAYALVTDRQNNLDSSSLQSLSYQLADVLLETNFKKRMKIANQDELQAIGLRVLNITKEKLQAFLKTQAAKDQIKQFELADEAIKNTGVPSFIVNGKYQILPKAFDSLEVLGAIIDELSNMP